MTGLLYDLHIYIIVDFSMHNMTYIPMTNYWLTGPA